MTSLKGKLAGFAFNFKDYLELRPAIRGENYRSLRSVSLFCAIVFGILFVISFLADNDVSARNHVLYGVIFGIILLLYIISPFLVKKIPSSVAFLVYVFVLVIHAFGIYVGTVAQVKHPATSYIVLLFVIPIMFIDRPWRNGIFNFISGSFFLYLSYRMKQWDIFFNDFCNIASFYVLATVCGRYFTRMKIQQLKFIKVVETERDTDNLTGVLTKAAFLREIDRLLSIDSSQGVFVMIDIDNFKQFNDKYGHDFGDKVLKTLGECMNNSFRRSDLLGRFGGDEFFVFIPSTNETDVALYRAKSLQIRLASDIEVPQGGDPVTLSIGISNCKGIGETYETLMKRADEAIYGSKAAGKDSITVN